MILYLSTEDLLHFSFFTFDILKRQNIEIQGRNLEKKIASQKKNKRRIKRFLVL